MPRTSLLVCCLVAGVVTIAAPHTAGAFCGFYVSSGDTRLFNDATQVVLMRDGTRTVLAMQNDYKGPPEAFAMVVPVPVVLHEGDVKTLPRDVFDHVDRMGAPRLVEYWEQDPCATESRWGATTTTAAKPSPPAMAHAASARDYGVTVEAQFVVGEYQVVILSATESTGLDAYLRANHYKIPDDAEPLLRPYVESGMKFFVAKVDPAKVKFENGHAALSPLRFHYDSDDFTLPIRLGLANSEGTQDLIVSIFAPRQRYEVANHKNVFIPTNLDVADKVRDEFAAFYAALYDDTLKQNPGAVVTEYAWQATSCDPCPGPTLRPDELKLLGADVLHATQPEQPRYRNMGMDLVLTRLHARYGKDLTDDLVFKKAEAVTGGRESYGTLERGAKVGGQWNNFQARYAIRHAWTGAMTCEHPQRGRWGGPPGGGVRQPIAAQQIAFAPRGQITLANSLVATPVSSTAPTQPPVEPKVAPVDRTPATQRSAGGCGCDTGDATGWLGALATLGAIAATVRPRRHRRRVIA
jgi:hypothetical protein